ncbi:MAG: hypothetical protein M1422_03765 [Candidatus Thermoplasmatota archaeon]|jgi:hypothetical protein|nr:hypothetical protein [Candidatus Sysuiplasma jiujiangense]MCL4317370.1 hypothetical protein [Candidatus Thermoplasmatota archaeon]MBX8640377.1 hypothetical protein [Candidatus Sysuiplasma jiujiangense]MBX8642135.1 hypothetical protein [Candidatus Sysuiplasma jiujiangense]MCL5254106.1 hypothetical protein [Candidatus Thermoplasmatota archaeon]
MEKTNLCRKCINWDHRPEGNPGELMGYCIAKKKNVGPHYECDLFQPRTPEATALMNSRIYGAYEENSGDEFDF